jgi:ERF superfamily protein
MSNGQTPAPRRAPMVPGPTQGLQQKAPEARDRGPPDFVETARTLTPYVESPPSRPSRPHGKLTGAISKVMAEVGTIRKGGHNKFHNYDYARMEDILQALTPLMGKHGLAVFQSETDVKMIEGNRMAVTYEFTVAHESGEERSPQRQSFTVMARDSKGNFDDKALSKAHTGARKYFLLSLFQVPAGDFPDSEEDETPSKEKRTIPGPGAAKQTAKQTEKPVLREAAISEEPIPPQKIGMGPGAGADSWARKYIEMIGKAKSRDEIAEWDNLNDPILQKLSEEYRDIYSMIGAAVERRLSDLGQAMPDPKKDAQEAMNWVASELQKCATYDAAESFWNLQVAPREREFDRTDWEMLMAEWSRAEQRLGEPTGDQPG